MKYKVISKKSLRVRKSATTKSKTIKYLKNGTIIDVDKTANGWAHVPKYGGYCSLRLLKLVNSEVTTQNTTEQTKPVVTPEKEEKPSSNAQKIAKWAKDMAYTTNTSSAKYPSGKPTQAYYDGFRKAFSTAERNKWSWAAHRVGANCGGFVGACVRLAGVDPKFPHTAAAAFSHLDNTKLFKRVEAKASKLQDGDIIDYRNSGGGCHICIYYGGQIKEASAGDFYPKTTNSVNARINSKGKSKLRVYRAI